MSACGLDAPHIKGNKTQRSVNAFILVLQTNVEDSGLKIPGSARRCVLISAHRRVISILILNNNRACLFARCIQPGRLMCYLDAGSPRHFYVPHVHIFTWQISTIRSEYVCKKGVDVLTMPHSRLSTSLESIQQLTHI